MTPLALATPPAAGTFADRYDEALAARYGERVAYCSDLGGRGPAAVAQALGGGKAHVVVLGPQLAVLDALCISERLDRTHPEIAVLLLAEPSPELWELALEAGVRRLVRPDAALSEITTAVEALFERVDRQRSNTVIDLRDSRPVEATVTRGRVITVLSPKGGSGKTTVATNLAAGLARSHPDRVAIVDLDVQFGDVADALLLVPTHTLADLSASDDVDGAGVKLVLTPTAHGLFALCAPDDPATGEEVPLDAVARAIDALAADMDYVVIDTGAGIDAAALTAIEASSDLVFVGSLDVPSIRSVRKLIVALDQLGMTDARRHVVLNRSDSDVGISASDVVATLDMPIAVEIPSSRSVPASINTGTPVILGEPGSNVARMLQGLVGQFTDLPVAPARKRSLFGKGGR